MIRETLKITEKMLGCAETKNWSTLSELESEQVKNIESIMNWLSKKNKSEVHPAIIETLRKIVSMNQEIITSIKVEKTVEMESLKKVKKGHNAVSKYL